MSESNLTVRPLLSGEHREAAATQLRRAQQEQVQRRVRDADATLWGPTGTPEIADRLGWLTIAERMRGRLPELHAFASKLAEEGIEEVLLMGMGGSSLAPEVFRRTVDLERERAGLPAGGAGLRVLDTTHSDAIRGVDDALRPRRTLFLVSSKSGGTLEPRSMLEHFWEVAGEDGSRFAAITDAGSDLERIAAERGFRRVFHGDPEIGGRYSALSPFGVLPAALTGFDVEALLARAQRAWETEVSAEVDAGVPAWLWLGAALSALARAGADKLTFVVPESLDGLGLWLEQLFAESTGKHGTGILPVAQEPICDPDDYGDDRVFMHITDLGAPEPEQTVAAVQALAGAGHPVIEVPSSGPGDLGRIFMLAELGVAVAGWGLQINPFDQPNVQEAKDATNEVLAASHHGEVPDSQIEQVRELIAGASPPSYVALMGYVCPSADFEQAVAQLRRQIMRATRATTTFGYGPRFLHSTGQFHKGGPPTGRFLQVIHDGGEPVPVPGKPYTFTELMRAQADGDFQTLRSHGLPVARVTLAGEDPAAALLALGEQVAQRALK